MANVAPRSSTRWPDEEPDVDEAPHLWLDDPNSPAYEGLCEHCGHHHDTNECPNVTAVVWRPWPDRDRRHRATRRAS